MFKLLHLKGQYEVTRGVDHGITMTSNVAPPDVASMVESFKIAAAVSGDRACELSSASDPVTALNIIKALMSKPEPIIIPTVEPRLLAEMREAAKKDHILETVIGHYDNQHATPEERNRRAMGGPGAD